MVHLQTGFQSWQVLGWMSCENLSAVRQCSPMRPLVASMLPQQLRAALLTEPAGLTQMER